MKNTIQHALKLYLVLVAVFLFIGCENEMDNDIITSTESIGEHGGNKESFDRVNIEDVKGLNSFMTSNLNGVKTKNSQNKQILQTPYGTVNTEDVLSVSDSEGNINYTFRIQTEYPSLTTFYNLIVQQPAGEIAPNRAYVLKYMMSKEFKTDYFAGNKTLNQFKGKIQKFSLNGFRTVHKSNRFNECPIDEEEDEEENNPLCELEVVITNGDSDSNGDPDDSTDPHTGDAVNSGSEDSTTSSNSNSSNSSSSSSSSSGTGSGSGSNSSGGTPSTPCTISFSYLPCSFGGGADGHASQSAGNGSTAMCGGSPLVMNTSGDCSGVTIQENNIVNNEGLSSKMMGDECSMGSGTVGMDNKPYGGVAFSPSQMEFLNSNCPEALTINNFAQNYLGLDRAKITKEMTNFLMMNPNTDEDLEFVRKMATSLKNNTPFDYGEYLNPNAEPTFIGCPFPPCNEFSGEPVLWTYGAGMVRGGIAGLMNIILTSLEWGVPDYMEGQLVRDVMKLRGIPIRVGTDNKDLGMAFQVRFENMQLHVQYDEGFLYDIAELGLSVLDVLAVISPSTNGGAFIFAKGAGRLTKTQLSLYLKSLKKDLNFASRLRNLSSHQMDELLDLMKKQKKPQGYADEFDFNITKNIDGTDITIRYDENGFPDFTGFAKQEYTYVSHELIGHDTANTDFKNAYTWLKEQFPNANIERSGTQVIIDGIPHTWHHHEDGLSVMPIPYSIHRAFVHSGGAAIIRGYLQGLFGNPIWLP